MIRYYSMTTLKIQRYTEYTCTCISRILMYTYCICPWGKFQNGTSPFLLGHNEIEDIPILMTDRCNDNNNQYLVYIFHRKSLNTSSTIIKCFRGWQLWFSVIHQQKLYKCRCIFLKIIWYKNMKTKKRKLLLPYWRDLSEFQNCIHHWCHHSFYTSILPDASRTRYCYHIPSMQTIHFIYRYQ